MQYPVVTTTADGPQSLNNLVYAEYHVDKEKQFWMANPNLRAS